MQNKQRNCHCFDAAKTQSFYGATIIVMIMMITTTTIIAVTIIIIIKHINPTLLAVKQLLRKLI
jgi:hypothetical protein